MTFIWMTYGSLWIYTPYSIHSRSVFLAHSLISLHPFSSSLVLMLMFIYVCVCSFLLLFQVVNMQCWSSKFYCRPFYETIASIPIWKRKISNCKLILFWNVRKDSKCESNDENRWPRLSSSVSSFLHMTFHNNHHQNNTTKPNSQTTNHDNNNVFFPFFSNKHF